MYLFSGGALSVSSRVRAEVHGVVSCMRSFSSSSIINAGGHENPLVNSHQLEGLEPELNANNRLVPLTTYGVKAMSMGFLVPQDSPIAWRGLMVQKAMNQLLFEVAWPRLDLLVLDLPPGTGDVQLTITQSIELAGAVIVTTPQDLALRDAVRGVDLFRKVNVPILGGRKKCEELGLILLGDIPLHPEICHDADAGRPTIVGSPDGAQARAFLTIFEQLRTMLSV
nr:iron-sulfur protein nubpl [Quercus suber]